MLTGKHDNGAKWHCFGGAFIVIFLLTSFTLPLLLSLQMFLTSLKVVSIHLKRSQSCNEKATFSNHCLKSVQIRSFF